MFTRSAESYDCTDPDGTRSPYSVLPMQFENPFNPIVGRDNCMLTAIAWIETQATNSERSIHGYPTVIRSLASVNNPETLTIGFFLEPRRRPLMMRENGI